MTDARRRCPGRPSTSTRSSALIETLLDTGHAYRTDDGSIFFRIASWPAYGKLARLDPDQLRVGERVEADEYGKDDIRDFALWKGPKPGEPSWDTAIGEGRPGWHIECSAMSHAHLGPTFDIHTGGVDLIFPHHEDEIAQSEAATGQPFVRTWLHCAHLQMGGTKMAKSLGNIARVGDLLDRGISPRALRYVLISAHYRAALTYTRRVVGRRGGGDRALRRGVLARWPTIAKSAPTTRNCRRVLEGARTRVRGRPRRRPQRLAGPRRRVRPGPRAQPADRRREPSRRPTQPGRRPSCASSTPSLGSVPRMRTRPRRRAPGRCSTPVRPRAPSAIGPPRIGCVTSSRLPASSSRTPATASAGAEPEPAPMASPRRPKPGGSRGDAGRPPGGGDTHRSSPGRGRPGGSGPPGGGFGPPGGSGGPRGRPGFGFRDADQPVRPSERAWSAPQAGGRRPTFPSGPGGSPPGPGIISGRTRGPGRSTRRRRFGPRPGGPRPGGQRPGGQRPGGQRRRSPGRAMTAPAVEAAAEDEPATTEAPSPSTTRAGPRRPTAPGASPVRRGARAVRDRSVLDRPAPVPSRPVRPDRGATTSERVPRHARRTIRPLRSRAIGGRRRAIAPTRPIAPTPTTVPTRGIVRSASRPPAGRSGPPARPWVDRRPAQGPGPVGRAYPIPPPPRPDLFDAEIEELVAGRRPVEEAFVARREARRLLVVPAAPPGAREARPPRDEPAHPDRRGRGRHAHRAGRVRRPPGDRPRRSRRGGTPTSTTSSPGRSSAASLRSSSSSTRSRTRRTSARCCAAPRPRASTASSSRPIARRR